MSNSRNWEPCHICKWHWWIVSGRCVPYSHYLFMLFFSSSEITNLRRLGGSKGWSLVFTKSSSVEIRTGNTITFNRFSISLSLNSDNTITFLKGYIKAYCIMKKLFSFFISTQCKQFILVSETLVGLDIPLCRIKIARNSCWVFWRHPLPVCACPPGSLLTGGPKNETEAAGEWYLLAN